MKLTNKLGLPEAIVRAVTNDPYSRGASDISVTGLITPPYQRRLSEKVEQVEDVAQRLWALVGQIGHGIAERGAAPTDIAEQRLFGKFAGKVVSGQFDLIEPQNCELLDFKFTSVWAVMNGGKIEWEQQLNALRVLSHLYADATNDERYRVEKLAIIAIFRDWQMTKAGKDGYPEHQVAKIEIPVWPIAKATAWIEERVVAHFADEVGPCTDEDRWATAPVYAVMKKDRKSALKLFPVLDAAEQMAKERGVGHSVEFRPRTYRRCENYCSVSHACPLFTGPGPGGF